MDFGEVQAYFLIEERIERLKDSVEGIRSVYYNRTFTTRIESDGMNVYAVSERIEDSVSRLVDTIQSRETAIEILEKKNRYFKEFLSTLSPNDKRRLKRKFLKESPPLEFSRLDRITYDEIQEIDEAINYMYKFPEGIKKVDVNNDSLESEFSQVLEALEV